MEYEAVPVLLLESFQIAHIQELGSIKLFTSSLVDDVDTIVQLLPLQKGVQVLQQIYQVLLSVPVGNEDSHPLHGLTFFRVIPASGHFGVFLPVLPPK